MTPPSVTRPQIIVRGLRHQCPNCGAPTLFEPGRYFATRPVCHRCGMERTKDEAAFLGSTTINYGVSVFGIVLPYVVVMLAKDAPTWAVIAVGAFGAAVLPLLLYRPSKSWWFMAYYLALPGHLPANWPVRKAGELPPDE